MSGEIETSQAEPDLTALEGFLVGNQGRAVPPVKTTSA
jgi:hypothetical protein